MEKRPFEGINVIELTWAGVGSFTTNFLGYFGATVVRVESTTRPDPVRNDRGYAKAEDHKLERGPTFAITHPVKKLDLTLNLKNPEGVEVFKKLVKWADVMIENFTTGAIEDMGIGYDVLKKIKPGIILHRTNGFGHTGPMAGQPGLGQTVTALTGFHGVTGWPDRNCVPISNYYTDQLAPLMGALTLITAISHMRKTGQGQCIDHSQVEAGINYLVPVILDYTVNGRELALEGNSCSYAAPHNAYRCKGEDRWVAIGVFTDAEWQAFCYVIGNPEWTTEDRFATLSERVKNSVELDKLVNAWTINYTAEQVMSMMQDFGVSAGVVANAQDSEEDPQLKEYDFFHEMDHPYMGRQKFYHPPGFVLSSTPAELGRPPLLGEYNEYICTKLLKIPKKDYEQLVKSGALE